MKHLICHFGIVFFLVLMAGCMTNSEVQREFAVREQRIEPKKNPFVATTSNPVLGRIVWVDTVHKRAVVQLNSNVIDVQRSLVSRNASNEPTGLLQPSGARKDVTLGVTIAYGQPVVGDQVVLREGLELPRSWGSASASESPSNSNVFPFVIPQDKQSFTGNTEFIRKSNIDVKSDVGNVKSER